MEKGMIKPTVGRVVWYWPHKEDAITADNHQPLAAIVARVWTDSCINLAVFDSNGKAHNRTSVLLVQDGENRPVAGFCEWMPYQKGQAAKTEAADKAMSGSLGGMIRDFHAARSAMIGLDPWAGFPGLMPREAMEQAGIQVLAAVEKEYKVPSPRITLNDIEANIAEEYYFTADQGARLAKYPLAPPLNLLTFCVLVLRNGFTVTGESACASPENFDAELGRKIARQNAVAKVWPLMGYALKERLAAAPADFRDRVRLEKQELDEKIRKLEEFIAGPGFENLRDLERKQLNAQLVTMHEYAGALQARIIGFDEGAAS